MEEVVDDGPIEEVLVKSYKTLDQCRDKIRMVVRLVLHQNPLQFLINVPETTALGVKLGDLAFITKDEPSDGESFNFDPKVSGMASGLGTVDGGKVVEVAPALGAVAVLDSVDSSSLEWVSGFSVPPRSPFCRYLCSLCFW